MIDFSDTALSDLLALCYRKERAAVRRRMAATGLPEERALWDVLTAAAGTQPLAELLAARRAERQRRQDKVAARQERHAQRLAARHATFPAAPADTWLAWFDGSARPNPGRMGLGAILQAPDGRTIELNAAGGYGDSSQAEYLALHAVLEAAIRHDAQNLIVHGDSRVVIDDVLATGRTAPVLAISRTRALELMAHLPRVTLRWVPRHRNQVADRLSQQASRAPIAATTSSAGRLAAPGETQ